MIEDNATTMIEVGPGKVLQGLTRKIDKEIQTLGIENFEQVSELSYV